MCALRSLLQPRHTCMLPRSLGSSSPICSQPLAPVHTPNLTSRACSHRQLANQEQQRAAAMAPAATAAASSGSSSSSSSSSSRAGRSQKDASSSSSNDVVLHEEPEQHQQPLPELQLQLPEPTNIQVKTSEFVKSSVKVGDCPPAKYPEFAVIGRSNVGKSSLINMLTNRKSLAMVSKQPGKTRCINHFLINNSWYLVDLPGYGYARTGKENRKEFEWFTKNFFLQRPTLTMVLLLVDSSIPPQPVDLEYAQWLGSKGVPFSIVFTKADKRKKGGSKKQANVTAFKRALLQQCRFTAVPPCILTSASSGDGKQELLAFIAGLRVLFEQQAAAGGGSKQPQQ